jgi:predicted acetyltransferase
VRRNPFTYLSNAPREHVTYTLRHVEPDEFVTFSRVAEAAFGAHPSDEAIERWRKLFEYERTMAAFDGDRMVGTAATMSYQLTLPGGTVVPAGGVTAVGVLPTHRRRGILTSLMRPLLADARDRGEPLSILYSSESSIYGRFGFGHATTHLDLEIAARRTCFAAPPKLPGAITMLDKNQAGEILPTVYERARQLQPGAIDRSPSWWENYLSDPEVWRDGASARFYVVYESAPGKPDGYVCYRVKDTWKHGAPQHLLIVAELMPVTEDAYAALWQFCLGVDLVETVTAHNRPIDEPLPWMLKDSRQVRVTEVCDMIWARLLDIPAALGARRYAVSRSVVFDVIDDFFPENTGRYQVEGGCDGSHCRRTNEEPDLRLSVVDLGAAYFGGVRFHTLARAGRVVECTEGALGGADLMFASEPQAWCATHF